MNRVLHITPALFGSHGGIYGGAERYTFELARNMALQVPTALVSFGDRPQRFQTTEGLQVEVLGPAWRIRGQEVNRFHPRLFRAIASANIIHCHQPHLVASSVTALISRLTGKKVFASDLGGGGWDLSAYMNTDPWYHGHLHLSEYSRLQNQHQNWDRARVIYGGVDTDRFHPNLKIAKEPLVVFVGRLMPHKGIRYLVDGLPEGLYLEIIGRPYDSDYTRFLQSRAVNKSIYFRTDCHDDEIIRSYQRAIAVVLPSVYHNEDNRWNPVPELLGQTLIEGMSCGIPGIATRVASLPEVVEDGISGFYVEPNSAESIRQRLELLRDRPEQVQQMGRAARDRVLKLFTWPQVIDRCLQAYRELGN